MSNNKVKQRRKLFKTLRQRWIREVRRKLGRRMTAPEMKHLIRRLKTAETRPFA